MRHNTDGVRLTPHLQVLEDPSRQLTLQDVQSPQAAGKWRALGSDGSNFGLTESAFWLRFQVRNPSSQAHTWLLEVAYPHLDQVQLFVPQGDGYSARTGGDSFPFHQRELTYRNLVFSLEEAAGSQATYYVRVQTSGSASVPLVAWSTLRFLEHQNRELSGFWLFYGVMLVMAVYNLFLFLFLREREYLYYVLSNVSLLLFEFTINGHSFQYLVPNHIWLANHLVPISIGMTYLWKALFAMTFMRLHEHNRSMYTLARVAALSSAGMALLALFAPYAVTIRVLVLTTALITVLVPITSIPLLRSGQREAKLYTIAWSALILGVILYISKTVGVLPSSVFTDWGIQMGAGLEMVLLSLALADRINIMRGSLAQLNGQLAQNVSDLKLALAQAEAGTRAKLDFLATVSHELRTPLNAIINIPEGLLRDFPRVASARCEACQTLFELESGDVIDESSSCPECRLGGTLRADALVQYRGEPELTARHLAHIERSGKHLLQMVNGILDFSKVEAGKLSLTLDRFNLAELLAETTEQLSELAKCAGVEMLLEAPEQLCLIKADRLRVKQVLINLIGNAIKFSDGDGQVTVSAHCDGDSCVISVRDRGIGIAPENSARIFQSFEQVHRGDTRKYGGTGLGLSICQALVALHDGRIWLDSELGQGSTFYVSLPLRGPRTQVEAPAPSAPHPSHPSSPAALTFR